LYEDAWFCDYLRCCDWQRDIGYNKEREQGSGDWVQEKKYFKCHCEPEGRGNLISKDCFVNAFLAMTSEGD